MRVSKWIPISRYWCALGKSGAICFSFVIEQYINPCHGLLLQTGPQGRVCTPRESLFQWNDAGEHFADTHRYLQIIIDGDDGL